jgi:hypothetical protein
MTARPRLLLVYPSTHKLGWVRRFQLPSLSLKLVAAATPPEWDVVLADELHEDIPFTEDFDAVGITAMTHQAVRAYQIADRFRLRGIPVILGGMHATVLSGPSFWLTWRPASLCRATLPYPVVKPW